MATTDKPRRLTKAERDAAAGTRALRNRTALLLGLPAAWWFLPLGLGLGLGLAWVRSPLQRWWYSLTLAGGAAVAYAVWRLGPYDGWLPAHTASTLALALALLEPERDVRALVEAYVRGGGVLWGLLTLGVAGALAGAEGIVSLGSSTKGAVRASDPVELTPEQVLSKGRRTVRWAIRRLFGKGLVTMIAAYSGGGKTWMSMGSMGACQDATPDRPGDFMGEEAYPFRWLYYTEEGPELFAEKLAGFGLTGGTMGVLYHTEMGGREYEEIVAYVERRARKGKYDGIWFDTLSTIAPFAEASGQGADRAMTPLVELAQKRGYAVAINLHNRKGAEDAGIEGVRGHSNLVSKADILVTLSRQGSVTTLQQTKRYGDRTLSGSLEAVDGVPTTGRFVACPPPGEEKATAKAEAPKDGLTPAIRDVFTYVQAKGAEGATIKELCAFAKVAENTMSLRLKKLTEPGLVEMAPGTGTKKTPGVWRVPQPSGDAEEKESAPPATAAPATDGALPPGGPAATGDPVATERG